MSDLLIHGGVPLAGTVSASGAKNAALPMMAASILADGPVRLEGVPQLNDVTTLAQLLEQLGVRSRRDGAGRLELETVESRPVEASYELVRRMRASFCVLGPLVARRGRAVVPLPGGCHIGPRPVDLHLAGLAALGAELQIRHGCVIARARRLRGATIHLKGPRGPTVTGTANVLCAAVLADGITTITGAAREPEIVDLGRMLQKMGARIDGLGTGRLVVTGVRSLGGVVHRIVPDRIEGATFLLAAAVTGGSVTVRNVRPEHMAIVLKKLRGAGFTVHAEGDSVHLTAHGPPRPLRITARPYPGMPSDLQAQWMALLALAPGSSRVADRVFPARFMHVDELKRLGARIELCGSAATIHGVPRLSGAVVTASDLRASAALVLAGLAARGTTLVQRCQHLDRGYQRLDEKLQSLGARLQRLSSPAAAPSRQPPRRLELDAAGQNALVNPGMATG